MEDCYQCDVTTENSSNWFKKDVVGGLQGIQETQDQGGSQASWGSKDKNQKAFLKQGSYFLCIHWSGPLCSLQTDVKSSSLKENCSFAWESISRDLLIMQRTPAESPALLFCCSWLSNRDLHFYLSMVFCICLLSFPYHQPLFSTILTDFCSHVQRGDGEEITWQQTRVNRVGHPVRCPQVGN